MDISKTALKKFGYGPIGEILRSITFVGDGYGCYENFDVRPDATPWSREKIQAFVEKTISEHNIDRRDFIAKRGYGYTFKNEAGITVDVFWYWDGDGVLYFRAREGDTILVELINTDCKCDDWRSVEDWKNGSDE